MFRKGHYPYVVIKYESLMDQSLTGLTFKACLISLYVKPTNRLKSLHSDMQDFWMRKPKIDVYIDILLEVVAWMRVSKPTVYIALVATPAKPLKKATCTLKNKVQKYFNNPLNVFLTPQLIDEASHHVYADQPEEFNKVVENICKSVDWSVGNYRLYCI